MLLLLQGTNILYQPGVCLRLNQTSCLPPSSPYYQYTVSGHGSCAATLTSSEPAAVMVAASHNPLNMSRTEQCMLPVIIVKFTASVYLQVNGLDTLMQQYIATITSMINTTGSEVRR
jgi:hypothetical protein